MAFRITTSGTLSPVVFFDLGARSFDHPTVAYDLQTEYSIDELAESEDLANAIALGHINVVDADGEPITDPSVIDHGSVGGLGDDDHLQYLTEGRGDALYSLLAHVHDLNQLTDVTLTSTVEGNVLFNNGTEWINRQLEDDDINVHVYSGPGISSINVISLHTMNTGVHSVGIALHGYHGTIEKMSDTSIKVWHGAAYIRPEEEENADLEYLEWAMVPVLDVSAFAAGMACYVYLDYAGGAEVKVSATNPDPSFTSQTVVRLADVHFWGGVIIDIHDLRQFAANHAQELSIFHRLVFGTLITGLIASETGAHYLQFTPGIFHRPGFNNIDIDAFDTAGTDTFMYMYGDGVGGFTMVPGAVVLDTQKYDDGSGTLATLTAGYFKKDIITRNLSGSTHILYGKGQYASRQDAEDSPIPELPMLMTESHHGFKVAVCVSEGGVDACTFSDNANRFAGSDSGVGSSDHGSLTGLTDDDHPVYHTNVRGDMRYYLKTEVDTLLALQDEVSEMLDVTLTTPADNDVFAFDTTLNKWINQTANAANLPTLVQHDAHVDDTANPHQTSLLGLTDVSSTIVPAAGHVLTYDEVAGEWTTTQLFVEGTLQTIQSTFGSISQLSGTALLPITTTAMDITKGAPMWSQTFTPSQDGSLIKITMSFAFNTSNAAAAIVVGLFRDNINIGAMVDVASSSNGYQTVSFTIKDPGNLPGGVEVTYQARIGKESGNATFYINTSSSGENFGGVLANNAYTIEEVVVL